MQFIVTVLSFNLVIPTFIFAKQATGKRLGEKATLEGIEVALNPEELDLDTTAMQAKYDQTLREQQSQLEKEDLSDMVAEHAAKQSKVGLRLMVAEHAAKQSKVRLRLMVAEHAAKQSKVRL